MINGNFSLIEFKDIYLKNNSCVNEIDISNSNSIKFYNIFIEKHNSKIIDFGDSALLFSEIYELFFENLVAIDCFATKTTSVFKIIDSKTENLGEVRKKYLTCH